MTAGVPAPAGAPDPLEVLTRKWESLNREPNRINDFTQIDVIRRREFQNRMERALVEKDPRNRTIKENQAYSIVRQDFAYFIGEIVLGPGAASIPESKKIGLFRAVGTEFLDDKYPLSRE